MTSFPAVRIENLDKSFGTLHVIREVSFDIQAGQVVGFIGANGAGKTTTMRMMATLELPDAGTILINGHDVVQNPGYVRRNIGWMPDSYGAYDMMSVWEYLDFFARAYGFKGADRARRVTEVMEFTDLISLAERPMNKLSKGMSQRLCLGRTLLPDPSVLILDEPAAGLDPRARIEFKRLVRLLAAQGKTLFISSHILTELEEMCDALIFIDNGRIVHQGSSESLKHHDSRPMLVRIEVDGPVETLAEWLQTYPGVALHDTSRRGARARIESAEPARLAELLRALVHAGIPVTEFHHESVKLEDAFVDILNNAGDRHDG